MLHCLPVMVESREVFFFIFVSSEMKPSAVVSGELRSVLPFDSLSISAAVLM